MDVTFVILLRNAIMVAGNILTMLIFVRIILSWIRIGLNPVTQFIYNITEIFLSPIRNLLAKSPFGGPGMMLDFSPLICMLMIRVVSQFLANAVLLLL